MPMFLMLSVCRQFEIVPRLRQSFASLWTELATAKWVAETGLPLAVAILAIYVAYRFVKHQMDQAAALAKEGRNERVASGAANTLRAASAELLTLKLELEARNSKLEDLQAEYVKSRISAAMEGVMLAGHRIESDLKLEQHAIPLRRFKNALLKEWADWLQVGQSESGSTVSDASATWVCLSVLRDSAMVLRVFAEVLDSHDGTGPLELDSIRSLENPTLWLFLKDDCYMSIQEAFVERFRFSPPHAEDIQLEAENDERFEEHSSKSSRGSQ